LHEAGFRKFNKGLLLHPKYTKTEELTDKVYNFNANYEYIESITVRMKSQKSVIELTDKIATLEQRLEELKKKTWKALWLEEINELEKVVRLGVRTKWLFKTTQHSFE
jgi:hypothetical protein